MNVSRPCDRCVAALATAVDVEECADPMQASGDATDGRSSRADCGFRSHFARYCARANAKRIATESLAGSRARYAMTAKQASDSGFDSSNAYAIDTAAVGTGGPYGSNCPSYEDLHGTSRHDYSCTHAKSDMAADAEKCVHMMADKDVREWSRGADGSPDRRMWKADGFGTIHRIDLVKSVHTEQVRQGSDRDCMHREQRLLRCMALEERHERQRASGAYECCDLEVVSLPYYCNMEVGKCI